MKHPENTGSSASQSSQSPHPFLQDSSLITDLPVEQRGAEAQQAELDRRREKNSKRFSGSRWNRKTNDRRHRSKKSKNPGN